KLTNSQPCKLRYPMFPGYIVSLDRWMKMDVISVILIPSCGPNREREETERKKAPFPDAVCMYSIYSSVALFPTSLVRDGSRWRGMQPKTREILIMMVLKS